VLAHTEAQQGTPIPLRALSEIAKLSAAHFARAFRASFGMAPHRYIVDCRLRRASLLMLNTALPLCEIALVCGFADQPHFCRTFRKYFVQTPQAWRHYRRA
jgi:AraC-like DNA-binding protein